MAQTLEHNSAITGVAPVTIPVLDDDMVIIQKLDDEPNDVGGMSAAALKAEFDKAGENVKRFINNELIPTIIAADLTEESRANAEAERVTNEIERVSNETARMSGETERISNETGRAAAESAREAAEAARVLAEQSRVDVDNGIVAQATAQANAAKQSASEAAASESAAAVSATSAAGSAAVAATSASSASSSASSAATSANNAAGSATAAANAANKATNDVKANLQQLVTDAESAESGAKAAQAAAEKARDEAQNIVGGDFATKTEAQTYANTAESNANAYTNQQIAAIPTPDVSGQIAAHNADTAAHSDIRQLIANKKGAQVYTATIGTSWAKNEDTGVKTQTVSISGVTADQTAKVDHSSANVDGTADGYATFVEEENQYLKFITNGFAETVSGGIKFTIFGNANTVSIPIVVEAV